MLHLASKLGQIRPKWDKYGTFKDQFSVHFGRQILHLCSVRITTYQSSLRVLKHKQCLYPRMTAFLTTMLVKTKTGHCGRDTRVARLGPDSCQIWKIDNFFKINQTHYILDKKVSFCASLTFLIKSVHFLFSSWPRIEPFGQNKIQNVPFLTQHRQFRAMKELNCHFSLLK